MSVPIVSDAEGLAGLGQAFPDHIVAPAPAAGAGLIFPLDATWWWRIIAARFTLTTSAAVANRFVMLDFCDPEGTPWIRNPALAVQAAGVSNQEYDFAARSVGVSAIAGEPMFASMTNTVIPAGWQLRVNIDNVQAADQLSAVRLYVEKFLPVT